MSSADGTLRERFIGQCLDAGMDEVRANNLADKFGLARGSVWRRRLLNAATVAARIIAAAILLVALALPVVAATQGRYEPLVGIGVGLVAVAVALLASRKLKK